jgi:UDP-N-acetylglucosamine pyrophosphorylase
MNIIEDAKDVLIKYNQPKIMQIFNLLAKDQQEHLAKEILETNFSDITELYKNKDKNVKNIDNIEPIEFVDKNKINELQKAELSKIGENIIKSNQYAVVTMAGGQGTRLGWKGPKGTFKLNIGQDGKYIFEIFVDTLKQANKIYGTEVYWYIMTSVENNDETIKFFEEHNYFGYNKEKIKFFKQGILPLIDTDGNLLINTSYSIKKASDGNGSVFKSLKNSHMIEDMKQKGIKWVYICGVDNIMVNMVDSLLLGLAISKNTQSASKSVKKSYPEEKVGIFCKKNGKPAIIEYIDMTEDMIYAKNSDGELLYGESNIISHLFTIEALEKIADHNLKYHCACKKNSYINENLQEVIPTEPNTYKFESFIFDGFECLDNMIIMRVNREDEFAPVKNATGVDSPETAVAIYNRK